MKKTENELFVQLLIVADIRNKKLRITERVIKNLKNIGSTEATMYFQYKHLYPDYEEVIIPDLKPVSLA